MPEELYRIIFEHAPDACYINDLEGRFVAGNRAAEILTGYSREDLIGSSFFEQGILPEDHVSRAARALARNYMGEPIGPERYQLRRKDGSRVDVEIRSVPLEVDGRKLVLGIARDLTARNDEDRQERRARAELEEIALERSAALVSANRRLQDEIEERRRAEAALRQSEQKYRAAVEQSMECMYLVETGTLRVIEANPALQHLLGYTREELLSMTEYDFLDHPSEDIDRTSDWIRSNGRGFVGERRYVAKSGSIAWVEVSASVISWRDNEVFCVVARDTTERRRAAEERQRVAEQFHQAQKMEAIGVLAGGIAHDFNNILTSVMGHAELASRAIDEDHPARKHLAMVERSSTFAAELTRKLLLFSRKEPIQIRPMLINYTVGEMGEMLARILGDDIETRFFPEPELWTVRADESGIEQVLLNLAVNARDAMPDGGLLTIRTSNVVVDESAAAGVPDAREGRFVCLSVEDSGIGMDDETLEHVFEPFFTTKKAGQGTGLGLAAVFGIVKQHEGWIGVDSTPGRGSTFRVFLPATDERAPMPPWQGAGNEQMRGKGEKVLVVEDSEDVLVFTTRGLSENGYEVVEARSAAEALERIDSEQPLVLFSDVVLPDRSGLELACDVASRNPGTRIVLTSGYAGEKSRQTAIDERGMRFLRKPFSLCDLLEMLRSVIDGDGDGKGDGDPAP